MGSFEKLNYQYDELLNKENSLVESKKSISNNNSNDELSIVQKVEYNFSLLKSIVDSVSINDIDSINAVILIYKHFLRYSKNVESYNSYLLSADKNISLVSITDSIVNERETLNTLKKSYESDYRRTIISLEDLLSIGIECLDNSLKALRKEKKEKRDQARQILGLDTSIELSGNEVVFGANLPENMVIGRYSVDDEVSKLMKDIKVNNIFQNISINLRSNGNLIIKTDFSSIDDSFIDDYIIAYIFRFIESFPLGSVNVHLFDKNIDYKYMTINNIFHDENAGHNAKNLITLHDSINDINVLNTKSIDIYKKLSNKSDLYSLYLEDQSEAFNLIIIRDGLIQNGFGSSDILQTIKHLTDNDNIGHKCGFRFLIIDDSSSREREINDNNKLIIDSIVNNAELVLNYNSKRIFKDNTEIEPLIVKDNIESFIRNKSEIIANSLNKKDKSYISLMDISHEESNTSPGSIIRIPVGKSGDKIIEIPLSCKDENDTKAGQCIGYIVIGQSGSGKSSFFHNVVLGGCLKYSPRDLNYWLLDFKYGGASSKYRDSGIPHIKIISENNKIDDAFCLFTMILEEMERRSKLFNSVNTDNIIDYNEKAKVDNSLEYFPRIIIAIDEIQEIFRDEDASKIKDKIAKISTRMRSSGIHFIMVAQNLSDGKSYMLKEAFTDHVTGRVCFRVDPGVIGESGFNETFTNRKEEISKLTTGEAYVSYGDDTINKVKMSFVPVEQIRNNYSEEIIKRYPAYSIHKPLVIGSKKKLLISDLCQRENSFYSDILHDLDFNNGFNYAVIGEDVYSMQPKKIHFSQSDNSTLLLLGSDRIMSSSLCASVALSLVSQNEVVHLFNGDKTPIANDNMTFDHPFMHVCKKITQYNSNFRNHRLDQFKDVVRDLYSEMLHRERQEQESEYSIEFEREFLVVNDLFGIQSFTNNEVIENITDSYANMSISEKKSGEATENIFDGEELFDIESPTSATSSELNIVIQNALELLIEKGYKYNIHVVLAIKRASSKWHPRMAFKFSRILLFNENDYAADLDNPYYVKEMLKNISNNGNEETLAVWYTKKSLSKIRPIIYDISEINDRQLMDSVMRNERSIR